MGGILLAWAEGPRTGQGHSSRMRALAEALRDVGYTGRLECAVGMDDAPPLGDPASFDHVIVDVPDRLRAARGSGCVWVSEVGDVTLPDGRALVGLSYALLRRGFRERRPVTLRPARARLRLWVHHAILATPTAPTQTLVRLTNHPHPWEVAVTCDGALTYPSVMALEAACLGLFLTLMPARNAGEVALRLRLEDAARAPGIFHAVDGRGAERVARAILGRPPIIDPERHPPLAV